MDIHLFSNHSTTNCRIFLCILLFHNHYLPLDHIFQVSNWVFIIFSFIVMPIGLRIERNISKNILIHFYKQKAYYIICEFGTVNDKITKLQLPKNIFCNKLLLIINKASIKNHTIIINIMIA